MEDKIEALTYTYFYNNYPEIIDNIRYLLLHGATVKKVIFVCRKLTDTPLPLESLINYLNKQINN